MGQTPDFRGPLPWWCLAIADVVALGEDLELLGHFFFSFSCLKKIEKCLWEFQGLHIFDLE